MGHQAFWKILEEIITEFQKQGLQIPQEVMDDLKAAKTMIQVLKADPCHSENVGRLERYIGDVESYIISEGQKNFPADVDKWLSRLEQARRRPDTDSEEARFIHGISRHQKWVRVAPTPQLTTGKLKTLARKSNLLIKVQEDGHLLVYGQEDNVKDFVKKMARECAPKPQNNVKK